MNTFRLRVVLIDWHDGDSFHGVLDQGMGLYRGKSIQLVAGQAVVEPIMHRCWKIDAAELKTGRPGQVATEWARQLAPPGVYECVSYKPDDFSRPLVDLVLGNDRMFSDAMIRAGYAVPFQP